MGLVVLAVLAVAALTIWALVAISELRSRLERLEAEIAARLDDAQSALGRHAKEPRVKPPLVAPPPPRPVFVEARPAAPSAVGPRAPVFAPSPVRSPAPAQPSEFERKVEAFLRDVDWEQFTGVKLFAWIGGAALFAGAAFFLKYSIDNNLIPPQFRLMIGALTGLGLVGWSLAIADRNRYAMTVHSLAAGGIAVLYAVAFSATVYYEFIPKAPGFGLVCVISAVAFVLALHHHGRFISVLGALGAYATPLLINTGHGNLVTLFVYLTAVNAGLFEVTRRTNWRFLLPLAAAGTLLALAVGAWLAAIPAPEAAITLVSLANLLVFGSFLARYRRVSLPGSAIHAAAVLVFGAELAVAAVLTGRPGVWPLVTVAASSLAAVSLAWLEERWVPRVIQYAVLSFLLAMSWAWLRFDVTQPSVSMLMFFLYGVTGGLGPLLLLRRHGADPDALRWLRVFPAALVAVGVGILLKSPLASAWFWPVLFALQAVGLALSLLVGSLVQAGVLAALVFAAGIGWFAKAPWIAIDTGFLLVLLLAGAGACLLTVRLARRLPTFAMPGVARRPLAIEESQAAAWVAALPALGPFILLAAVLSGHPTMDPTPVLGTATALWVLVLVLARRSESRELAVAGLAALAFTEGAWVMRLGPASPGHLALLCWSAAFWLAALTVPSWGFRPVQRFPQVWHGWALFEVAQFLLAMKACDALWPREAIGWVPLAFAAGKLSGVRALVVKLASRPVRNATVGFHGGALLFYLSSVPFLLLGYGWFGAALVFESAALLWLNRRVEHPGLRWVALALAPLGLALLVGNLEQLQRPDDLPVMNRATLAFALCVVALWFGWRQASHPRPELGGIQVPTVFQWLTVGTGFFLLNLAVADVFGAGGGAIRFASDARIPQYVAYTLIWTSFGAVVARSAGAPPAMRWAGLALLVLGAARWLGLPFRYAAEIAAMPPLLNLALIACLVPVAILAWLVIARRDDDPGGAAAGRLLLGLALAAGLLGLMVQLRIALSPGVAFALFDRPVWPLEVAFIAAWCAYGGVLAGWRRPLDTPFRAAGAWLVALGVARAVAFPLRYAVEFGVMTPVLNWPTGVTLAVLGLLLHLAVSRHRHEWTWPGGGASPRALWGVMFTLLAFDAVNVAVAAWFTSPDAPFSFEAHGNLAHQLAYSLSWLGFGLVLLVVGMSRRLGSARWAAIALFAVTAAKVFLVDLARLEQLYRVASLIGLAVILLVVSFLYQKNLKPEKA